MLYQGCNVAELVFPSACGPCDFCFSSHILMLTYSNSASAILKLLLNSNFFLNFFMAAQVM